jgi:hypothetical protein
MSAYIMQHKGVDMKLDEQLAIIERQQQRGDCVVRVYLEGKRR